LYKKEFRLNTSQVKITLNKDADLIVHTLPEDRGSALLCLLSTFDDEFIEILEENYLNQPIITSLESL